MRMKRRHLQRLHVTFRVRVLLGSASEHAAEPALVGFSARHSKTNKQSRRLQQRKRCAPSALTFLTSAFGCLCVAACSLMKKRVMRSD
jgi:hypothetical protein